MSTYPNKLIATGMVVAGVLMWVVMLLETNDLVKSTFVALVTMFVIWAGTQGSEAIPYKRGWHIGD